MIYGNRYVCIMINRYVIIICYNDIINNCLGWILYGNSNLDIRWLLSGHKEHDDINGTFLEGGEDRYCFTI